MTEVITDALLDSLKVLPFLILVYVLIEVLEHTASSKIPSHLLRGKLSPLIGAGVGVIPQCGFSVVATKLYSTRAIAMGTLLSVYISTSDEAIAVLISDFSAIGKLVPLLVIKVVFAVIVGYAVNFFVRKRELIKTEEHISAIGCHNHVVGRDDECGHCHEESEHEHNHEHSGEHEHSEQKENGENSEGKEDIDKNSEEKEEHHSEKEEKKLYRRNAIKRFVLHPLMHAATTFLYIFAVNLIFGTIIYYVGQDALMGFMGGIKYLQPLLAAIIGLIPNCGASVVLAQMYAIGSLSLGAALSGLCVSAGLGLAVLIKENKNIKDTLIVMGLLVASSLALGYVVTAVMAAF